MTHKTIRNIVFIDEDKCDGCGLCIPACAEGALQIINGKAKLISASYCDGLGACLGKCPKGAIAIEEMEAERFDEVATTAHIKQMEQEAEAKEMPACGFPLNKEISLKQPLMTGVTMKESIYKKTMLNQWPIQLALVSPNAPFFDKADLLLVADCVPFAYTNFHRDFLNDYTLLVACPKLDDFQSHLEKLTNIMQHSYIKSITILRMEIPCCAGLIHMARQAISASGKDIPLQEVIIGTREKAK